MIANVICGISCFIKYAACCWLMHWKLYPIFSSRRWNHSATLITLELWDAGHNKERTWWVSVLKCHLSDCLADRALRLHCLTFRAASLVVAACTGRDPTAQPALSKARSQPSSGEAVPVSESKHLQSSTGQHRTCCCTQPVWAPIWQQTEPGGVAPPFAT